MFSASSAMRSHNTEPSCDDFKGHAKDGKSKQNHEALTLYLFFLSACGLGAQMFDGIGLSTLPTLSVALQVLALGFLWSKVQRTRNVLGISAKTLQMQALVHGLRLCSTTWLKGYIPADATGDWLYQVMDALTLLLCLQLTYVVQIKHRSTYQEDLDTFDIKPVVGICFLLAILLHPDLNDAVFFDAIWATSLYIDVLAMMPQLWLMSKGGSVESLTGHYIAAVALSRGCSLAFWYYGYVELGPVNGGFNVAGCAVIVAHLLQAVIFCDFMYYYVRNWMQVCHAACSTPRPAETGADTAGSESRVERVDARVARDQAPIVGDAENASEDVVGVDGMDASANHVMVDV